MPVVRLISASTFSAAALPLPRSSPAGVGVGVADGVGVGVAGGVGVGVGVGLGRGLACAGGENARQANVSRTRRTAYRRSDQLVGLFSCEVFILIIKGIGIQSSEESSEAYHRFTGRKLPVFLRRIRPPVA